MKTVVYTKLNFTEYTVCSGKNLHQSCIYQGNINNWAMFGKCTLQYIKILNVI